MPPNSNYFNMTPLSQNITWTRNTPFPNLQDIALGSDALEYGFNFENTSVDWLSLKDHVYDPSDINFVNLDNGKVTPELNNLNLLTGNTYSGKIIFNKINYSRIHTVNLTILGTYSPIKTDKDYYSVIYNRETNTVSGETLVNILENTNNETISFETIGSSLFLEKTGVNSFTLEEDPAFPFSNNQTLPVTGTRLVGCVLKNASGNVLYSFTIAVTVINTNDITTDQPSVQFTTFKHLSESKSAVLKIINPAGQNFSVTAPSFVTASPLSGSSSVDLIIETDNSADLDAQVYAGNIEITYNSKVLKVPVTVTNVDFITFPIGDYNFCLDNFVLNVHRIDDTARLVRISMEIEITTPSGSSTVNSSYQIAYYNDRASTDIGRKIHNYFPVFAEPIFDNPGIEFNNVFICRPAIVKVIIEELDANYHVVYSKTYSNIKLFPGKKPKMFPVFTNSAVKRIYANSAHLFTYLTDLVQPSDITGQPVSSNPFLPGEINSVFFEDSDELITFGDYKKVLDIDFIRIPKGDNQIFYQYVNENLVPELFVFNGDYSIEENFEHNYDDDENIARKYGCKVVAKMTLNTGFVFKEEAAALSELNRRNLGFIKIGEDIFRVFPVTSKFRRIDSKENVNNYELEFLIVEYGN